jgi:hypothetical protein
MSGHEEVEVGMNQDLPPAIVATATYIQSCLLMSAPRQSDSADPHWVELAKKAPDVFWRTHERLLADLAKVAIKREGARREKTTVR